MSWGLVFGHLASGVVSGVAKYTEGTQSAETDRYRASLAEENAQRADLLSLEREERARREGILDAGLFQIKAEMSGLSGVSRDMWVGQRYMDVYKEITNARTTRSQTVNRFLKEARWHRDNADATDKNKWLSIGASVLTSGVNAYGAYDSIKKGANNG